MKEYKEQEFKGKKIGDIFAQRGKKVEASEMKNGEVMKTLSLTYFWIFVLLAAVCLIAAIFYGATHQYFLGGISAAAAYITHRSIRQEYKTK